jgi:hypothetical protein
LKGTSCTTISLFPVNAKELMHDEQLGRLPLRLIATAATSMDDGGAP